MAVPEDLPQEQTPPGVDPPGADPPGSRPPGADPPRPGTPLWTESQTPVKTLPCPNFVAGGKNDGVMLTPQPGPLLGDMMSCCQIISLA